MGLPVIALYLETIKFLHLTGLAQLWTQESTRVSHILPASPPGENGLKLF